MKVLFVKDYQKLGRKGELKDVSDGMARNLLLPKGFAVAANLQLQTKINKEQKDAEEKKLRDIERAGHLKSDIEGKTFTVQVKTGKLGQMFGSVKEKDIIEVVNRKMGTHFEKNALVGAAHIKGLGMHEMQIKLHSGLSAKIKINIEGTA